MRFYLYRDNYVVKIGEGDEQLSKKLESQGYDCSIVRCRHEKLRHLSNGCGKKDRYQA